MGAACFWAIDLHVHTPASNDVDAARYIAATPEDLVQAALDAGLDAIAVTDHNTASWCDDVSNAAAGTELVVLPGVELSTSEGHLLAVWEEGTPATTINDLLVSVGFGTADHGNLDIAADRGFQECAAAITKSGGIAIAAHADGPKGLLRIPVADTVRRALNSGHIAAVELRDPKNSDQVESKLDAGRIVGITRGSDAHSASDLGARHTWIKAGRPDLVGLTHALGDPGLRVRLEGPPTIAHAYIESVEVTGGFLDGKRLDFCPDLNCLLGGTGTGKSLALELVRFALDQQADASAFPAIRDEVDRRLYGAFGVNSTVTVEVVDAGGSRSTVRRVFDGGDSPAPEVVKGAMASLPIRAFSQSEIIEYARAPVGRMALVDSGIDLGSLEADIDAAATNLNQAASEYCTLLSERRGLEAELLGLPAIVEKVETLSKAFDQKLVDKQAAWATESAALNKLKTLIEPAASLTVSTSAEWKGDASATGETDDLYEQAKQSIEKFASAVQATNSTLVTARSTALAELDSVLADWKQRYDKFDADLVASLEEKGIEGQDLKALQKRLQELQQERARLEHAKRRLETEVEPGVAAARSKMDAAAGDFSCAKLARTEARRARAAELNKLMKDAVKLKVNKEAEDSGFYDALKDVAQGSNLQHNYLRDLATKSQPTKLISSYFDEDASSVAEATGVPVHRIEALFAHIASSDKEVKFVKLQTANIADTLSVRFKKPSGGQWAEIEDLAHGEKCTAVLVIALADGSSPLIIDQPEDALHAPWIEEHIVGRLRELRGTRQFMFATRSPGLVVSADAEQLITLVSNATVGDIEASGSLERHRLNELALYHLEGGIDPFRRRSSKLRRALGS